MLFIYLLDNDRSKIGCDGVSSFFEKLGLDLDDPLVLVIAYTLKAKEQGYFTKEEWMHGMEAFGLVQRLFKNHNSTLLSFNKSIMSFFIILLFYLNFIVKNS